MTVSIPLRPTPGAAPVALFVVLLVTLAVAATPLLAQSVAVGTASGLPGASVDVLVNFTSGATAVSSLQFDLGFSGTFTYVSTTAGAAAAAAGKSATGSLLAGGARIIVYGLNNSAVGSGALVVVRLGISGGASAGSVPITIGGIVASDPNGVSVSVGGSAGSVTVSAPADTTPPVISAVASTSVTQNSATITWTTNETSDSQVEFGTTASYGSLSPLTATRVTSHSSSLTGLSAGTLYHYRVRSRDASGNLAASGDYTFTTVQAADTTPPVISVITASSITHASATITWTTNENSDTQVDYGLTAAYGLSTSLNASMTQSHSASVSGLTAGTLYHYRVKSRDAAGNLATSGDYTFTTTQTADTSPPVISAVAVSSITPTSAVITWTTNEGADSQVEFGPTTAYGSLTQPDTAVVTSHACSLSGLTAGTLHHFRVKSRDAAGNLAISPDYTFTTTQGADTTPPVISAVAASSVTQNSAVVTWTTNENSDSQVEFGLTAAYGSVGPLDLTGVTSHASSLGGLAPGSLYHFRVRSRDAAGNLAISTDYTFTTTQGADTTPPVISGIAVTSVSSDRATILWSTNEDADSQVDFGASASYGSATTRNSQRVTLHTVIITDLSAKTVYHFRVKSADASGNLATSADQVFATTDVTGGAAKKKLYLPRLATFGGARPTSSRSSEHYTGVAIANLDALEASLVFTAYDAAGSKISGDGIINPSARLLKAGEQLPVVDTQLFGSGIAQANVGWVEVESTVTRIAGFFEVFDANLDVLDGTNVSTTPLTTFVLPEVESRGYTQLNVANPSTESAVVRIDLLRGDGTVRASATRTVMAQGALAVDTRSELFPDVVVDPTDYFRGSSDRGVMPFQIIGSNSEFVEVLAGQDAGAGAATLYCPQFAVGGGWRSTLSIVNLEGRPGTVTLRFIGDDAAQIGATRVVNIEAYGKVYVHTKDFFLVRDGDSLLQGYVEIQSSGPRLSGSVTFGDPEQKRFSSALPLVTKLLDTAFFAQVASDDVYFTGLAILNPNGTDAIATIDLYGADGRREGSVSEIIPARQRRAKVLTQLFPFLAGVNKSSGYLRVTVDKPAASFALFGTQDLSVLSAVPSQEIPH